MTPSLIKARIKRAAAALLYGTGLLWLLASRRLRNRAVVLMYHRVLPRDEASKSFSHPGIVVTPETFARHLDILKRHFRPLSLPEFLSYMDSGQGFPPKSCLITFDDGWADNHRYAMPLLRERALPAVVFAATDYIGTTRTFWQEQLGHLLYEATRHGVGSATLAAREIHLEPSRDEHTLRTDIARVVDRFRRETYDNIQALMADLSDDLREGGFEDALRPPDRFMDWRQLGDLSDNGISIASHTCSHRILTRLDSTAMGKELEQSRRLLESRLGGAVVTVAYPNGDFDPTVEATTRACGYKLAFTTQPGYASADMPPLVLPRMNIHETATDTKPLFLCRTLGIL
ncbi:polysaccharide deacetylase [Thioalkalivibrio sulfidiphilus HL-EbGr7]|uniref:Polysaccharide deacetylase n=1 Tax=Thioalkalivibrio sulfidiphilus (strain HL-EbGR7) TaxID=396588 RepID=B8GVA7_THISH|nr:polysaccharide deacetylase family protein [Thioalkalivibrio sulfidiphilus]ACL73453.1 polysaccharide deacetylase [Thioalkalivibrio sulfidiphilus HL-EbGr7]